MNHKFQNLIQSFLLIYLFLSLSLFRRPSIIFECFQYRTKLSFSVCFDSIIHYCKSDILKYTFFRVFFLLTINQLIEPPPGLAPVAPGFPWASTVWGPVSKKFMIFHSSFAISFTSQHFWKFIHKSSSWFGFSLLFWNFTVLFPVLLCLLFMVGLYFQMFYSNSGGAETFKVGGWAFLTSPFAISKNTVSTLSPVVFQKNSTWTSKPIIH